MKHRVILAVTALLTWTGVTLASAADLPPLARDGVVRFYVYHVAEFLEVRYAENGRWLPEAEAKLRKLLRSRGEDAQFPLDHRLVELADHLQDHFQADTVEVISAYRSPAFNKSLKEAGHNVANESFHIKGLAMDIHLDEIRENTLRDYLLGLKLGGVGYYGDKLMVHMDFGPVRRWQDGGFTENTEIGVFNARNPLKIRTDKLYYGEDESVTLAFTNQSGARRAPLPAGKTRPVLEKFVRGKWRTITGWKMRVVGESWRIAVPRTDTRDMSRFGKFRIRDEYAGEWQNSNEFYVKKE